METKTILANTKPECERALEFFSKEIAKIRTGQANPSLVEDIVVEAFEQKLPLKHVASISCPEPRQILIQPWDHSYIEPIEKAILKSGIGVSPIVDQLSIRIPLPQLTQEFRKNLLRLLGEKQESSKQTMRKLREEAWGSMQEAQRNGEIGEDAKFRGKEDLQKIIDEYIKKIDEMVSRKEREIMET